MFLTLSEFEEMTGATGTDDALYERCTYRARAYLNQLTQNRIRDETPVRECVKRAMAELIEAHMARESAQVGADALQSMSNDGVSVTYRGYLNRYLDSILRLRG